ncbi:MAG: hypothetical protein HC837_12880 [Chloroflexaceae bacterium]|nr:hypothetical protein [Chloroflexaceae bacterium]
MLDDSTQLHFPDSGRVELPFEFNPAILRCAAVGPGGHPLMVLLDTGTDPSAIDLELARQLGLRLGDFGLGQSAISNTVPFTETVIPWLRLGDLTLRNLFALALNLRASPFQVDLVLGYNVLRHMVLHIDYTRRQLQLSHTDLSRPASHPDAIVFDLCFYDHFPALSQMVKCDSLLLPLVTIDTGSNGSLTLSPDLADSLGLHSQADAVTTEQGDGFASRSYDVVCRPVDVVQLGPLTLRDVLVDTPGPGMGNLQQAGRANIGNRLLAQFSSVTVDYARKQCTIRL